MKRSVKKAQIPVFVIKHKNTARGSSMEGVNFKLTYVHEADAQRSSAYLTSLGVAHTLTAPKAEAA